jgi:NAD(P)-dependent dehydrogenase (short-subunit alcohol dehydrogenase family)
MMTSLDGLHALVTGAGSGIGAAIARAFANEGAAVSLVGRRKAPLEEIARNLRNATPIVADVTSVADCAAMVKAANAAHGLIDIVVANAGAAESAPIGEISVEHWHRMIGVNLSGAFFTVQAALSDVMREGEGMRRIVFTASTAGLKGYPYVAAYCAAKHGVVGLARALAVELKPSGVTVNAVCPGFTDTPLLSDAAGKIASKTGRTVSEARAALAKDNADGRLISPEQVADKVLWLCSAAAAGITGEAIVVGGRTA